MLVFVGSHQNTIGECNRGSIFLIEPLLRTRLLVVNKEGGWRIHWRLSKEANRDGCEDNRNSKASGTEHNKTVLVKGKDDSFPLTLVVIIPHQRLYLVFVLNQENTGLWVREQTRAEITPPLLMVDSSFYTLTPQPIASSLRCIQTRQFGADKGPMPCPEHRWESDKPCQVRPPHQTNRAGDLPSWCASEP